MSNNSSSNGSHFEGNSNSAVSTNDGNVVPTNPTETSINKPEISNMNLKYPSSDNETSEYLYNQAWFTTKEDKIIYHNKGNEYSTN